jgi:hypothetical protein
MTAIPSSPSQELLGQADDALEVDVVELVQFILGRLVERPVVRDASIVDEVVQPVGVLVNQRCPHPLQREGLGTDSRAKSLPSGSSFSPRLSSGRCDEFGHGLVGGKPVWTIGQAEGRRTFDRAAEEGHRSSSTTRERGCQRYFRHPTLKGWACK